MNKPKVSIWKHKWLRLSKIYEVAVITVYSHKRGCVSLELVSEGRESLEQGGLRAGDRRDGLFVLFCK